MVLTSSKRDFSNRYTGDNSIIEGANQGSRGKTGKKQGFFTGTAALGPEIPT
jgi:hypothetical protein